jgi:hypothetical protein
LTNDFDVDAQVRTITHTRTHKHHIRTPDHTHEHAQIFKLNKQRKLVCSSEGREELIIVRKLTMVQIVSLSLSLRQR